MTETVMKPFRAAQKANATPKDAPFVAKQRIDDDKPVSYKEYLAALRKGLESLEATGRKHGWLND